MSKQQSILFLILDYILICIVYFLTDFDLEKQGDNIGSLLLFLLFVRLIITIPYLGIDFLLCKVIQKEFITQIIGVLLALIWNGVVVFQGKEDDSSLIKTYILMCLPFLLSLFLSHKLKNKIVGSVSNVWVV